MDRGLLRLDGVGKCKSSFRYWLPESEERWRKDPLALIRMPELIRPTLAEESPRGPGAD